MTKNPILAKLISTLLELCSCLLEFCQKVAILCPPALPCLVLFSLGLVLWLCNVVKTCNDVSQVINSSDSSLSESLHNFVPMCT